MNRILPLAAMLLSPGSALAQLQEVTLFRLPEADPTGLMICTVNNGGTVAGIASVAGIRQAYLMKDAKFTPLLPLPGFDTVAGISAISDKGTVVGVSFQSAIGTLSFTGTIWRDGVPSPLPVPAPSQPGNIVQFRPISVNNSETVLGQVVEYIGGALGNATAKTVLLRDATFTHIPSPAAQPPLPVAINNPGDALVSVGHDPANGFNGPGFFLYRNGSFSRIPVPPGTFRLSGLNDQREVIGLIEAGPWFLLRNDSVVPISPLIGSVFTEYLGLTNKAESCGRAFSYIDPTVPQNYQVLRRFR